MKNLRIALPVLLLALSSCGNKVFKEAEKHYDNFEFASAAKLYENYLRSASSNVAALHLADCYRNMNEHEKAEQWYTKVINTPDASALDKLHYAEVLRKEGKYQEACNAFNEYLKIAPNDMVARNSMQACVNPEVFKKNNPFYEVKMMNMNGNASSFSPFIEGDKVYFTSESAVASEKNASNWTGRGYLDIYNADLDGSNSKSIPGSVNSGLHEGPAVISPVGDIMYFTRNRLLKNEPSKATDRDNNLEICQAHLVDGKWSEVQSLPFNSTEYSCGHPAITSNGTRMFFVSDMPGGNGGTDIYYSDLKDGNWSTPVNAGISVNTSGNEMFPTIRIIAGSSDEFYYSSDGLPGAGGLDIFKAAMNNDLPTDPKRMSSPFNSSSDDFGIVFTKDGRSGFFSSNRSIDDGTDRIYSFTRLDPKFFVKVTLVEKGTETPITKATLDITNTITKADFTMTSDDKGAIFFASDSLTSYGLCIRDKKYFACYGGIATGGFKGSFSDTSYVTLHVEKIVLNKPIRLENIYYDYNKWNIRPDAAIELDKLVKVLQDNPQIKIELSSHTDSRGSDKYNMTLSQKRAQSAVDYIVSKGISRDRITAKGYGESVPLNRCTNGVKCSEEEFQFNRRTEFKVTSILTQ